MKIIKASTSTFSLLFWVSFLTLALVWQFSYGTSIWNFSIVPLFFLIQIMLKILTKYEIEEETLTARVLFEKQTVDLSKIRSYSISKPNLFKQYILGFPKETISVKYNKFDDMEILSTDQAILDKLGVGT